MEPTMNGHIIVDHAIGAKSSPAKDGLLDRRKWDDLLSGGKGQRPALLLHLPSCDGVGLLVSGFDLVPLSDPTTA